MIGQIRFSFRGKPSVATLNEKAEWHVDGHVPGLIKEALDNIINRHEPSPADGAPYRRHVAHAAKILGGVAEFPELPPDPPGRVY